MAPDAGNRSDPDGRSADREAREHALVAIYARLYAQHVNQLQPDQQDLLVEDPCPLCGGPLHFTFPTLLCGRCAAQVGV